MDFSDTPDPRGKSSLMSKGGGLLLDETVSEMADVGGGSGGSVSQGTYWQYGITPIRAKVLRGMRTDIGEAARERLMTDAEVARLPLILETDFANVLSYFRDFFLKFAIPDDTPFELLEDDLEILSLMEQSGRNGENSMQIEGPDGQKTSPSFYQWKMLRYLERGAPESAIGVHYQEVGLIDVECAPPFDINLTHVAFFSKELYDLVTRHPAECLNEFDKLLAEEYNWAAADYLGDGFQAKGLEKDHFPRARVFFKPKADAIREFDASQIDRLCCVRGVVIRCSDVLPEMTVAAFRCTGRNALGSPCLAEFYEPVMQGEVREPTECRECKSRNTFELWTAMSSFSSKQLVKLSEHPGNLAKGEAPQSISIYVYDDLIDFSKPGDRVEITGILRASGVRLNYRTRRLNAVFRTYVDAIHILKDVQGRIAHLDRDMSDQRDTSDPFSDEILDTINKLRQSPQIYQILTDSFAPSIFGMDDVKKGLLCQLFGGSRVESTVKGVYRSDLHVLLCGDPSTAKSQLLQYVHTLAPRGVFTSGKGSSSVGLTAYVTKDPETSEFVLESGAVVLSDRGICCIDEFDKMDEQTRAVLHEVMEQQTVSIAKAGIVASLNARTSILAAANPVASRYDKRRAVVENINLPPSLFSRFDLIFLILDIPTVERDREVAEAICQQFCHPDHAPKPENIVLDTNIFSRYISYARANSNPKFTPQTAQLLQEHYVNMRQKSGSSSKTPTASPRQLESLIRISQALAKMRIDQHITENDVNEAVRLMDVATYRSLIDPTLGRIDFEQLSLGLSAQQRKFRSQFEQVLLRLLAQDSNIWKIDLLLKHLANENTEFYHEYEYYLQDYRLLESLIANMAEQTLINLLPNGSFQAIVIN